MRLRVAIVNVWSADDPTGLQLHWIGGNPVCRGLTDRGFKLELVFPPEPAHADILFSGPVGPIAYALSFERALKIFWTFESLSNGHDDATTRAVRCGCDTFLFVEYRDHEQHFDFSFSFDPTGASNF